MYSAVYVISVGSKDVLRGDVRLAVPFPADVHTVTLREILARRLATGRMADVTGDHHDEAVWDGLASFMEQAGKGAVCRLYRVG